MFLSLFLCIVLTQTTQIQTVYDNQKNLTTVSLPSTRLANEKGRYHSLSFSIDYSYPGHVRSLPERVNFELVSVVKARRLNTDLYVVFVADGKPIHFSSDRSAIPRPVPGRLWVGERMVFLIPREEFLRLAAAAKLAVKLGGVTFEFSEEMRDSVRAFAKTLQD